MYYTPEAEEFYIGFEYEIEQHGDNTFRVDNEWATFELEYEELTFPKLWLKPNSVRVKYLDSEDIKSLGFRQITDDCYDLPLKEFRGRTNQELRILLRETVLIYLAISPGDSETMVLFTGKIKNKSELKKLLKQLL